MTVTPVFNLEESYFAYGRCHKIRRRLNVTLTLVCNWKKKLFSLHRGGMKSYCFANDHKGETVMNTRRYSVKHPHDLRNGTLRL